VDPKVRILCGDTREEERCRRLVSKHLREEEEVP
jgi:hypothetical protein